MKVPIEQGQKEGAADSGFAIKPIQIEEEKQGEKQIIQVRKGNSYSVTRPQNTNGSESSFGIKSNAQIPKGPEKRESQKGELM